MPNTRPFAPDWASPPGTTIVDVLEERALPLSAFSEHMGCTREQVERVIDGRTAITKDTARRLEAILGGSAAFWLNRALQYREDLARRIATAHEGEAAWLAGLPVKDMMKYGWIPHAHSPAAQVAECRRFFDVPNPDSWRKKYRAVLQHAAFRTSRTLATIPGSLAAWLRRGEIQGASVQCANWSTEHFTETLQKVRPLTRKRQPRDFLPELTRLCAASGVAVAIVRAPAGCRASGATLFLSSTKALLLLSFRYLSDDHFWFTFFHEAGHLLLHGRKAVFIETDGRSDTKEREANDFAAELLVPPPFQAELHKLAIEKHAVRLFARSAGVSPGVIVGQLQHLRLARPNQLNALKARYVWDD